MKINLHSTSQKTQMLFLLIFLKSQEIDTGQGFKNCLNLNTVTRKNDNTSYNYLLKFPFNNNSEINNGKIVSLCCDDSQCFPAKPLTCSSSNHSFYCNKIAQTIFCDALLNECAGI